MKKQIDVLFIIDHLTANCGVRVRYNHVINNCIKLGLNIAVISDFRLPTINDDQVEWLIIKVEDSKANFPFKRRPFISFKNTEIAFLSGHVSNCTEQKIRDNYKWLDALNYSNEWLIPTLEEIKRFILFRNIRKTVIATQSFLGFAAMQIEHNNQPVAGFHTNYGAFYSSRILGEKDISFSTFKKDINIRIADFFFPKITKCFLSSFNSITEFDPYLEKIDNKHEFPGGVDIKIFKPKLNSKSQEFRIGFVGRLEEEKGINILIEVAQKLNGVHWIIIGDGTYKSKVEKSISKVSIYSSLSQYQLANELNKCDVFLFLSKWDTFGITVLEAMACSIPIISIEGSGISFLISKYYSGIIVSDEIEEIITAINYLKDSPIVRKNMGINGTELAEKMTWEIVCQEFLKYI